MTAKSSDVRAALQRHFPDEFSGQHERIIDGLAKASLIDDSDDAVRASDSGRHSITTISASVASDKRNLTLAKQVLAMAKFLNVPLDPDKAIDAFELSERMKAANVPLHKRYELKSCLAQLGVVN